MSAAATGGLRRKLTPSAARRESKRAKHDRAQEILRRLEGEYPDASCALTYANPLQLAVATILSAQCTDKRVNEVTPALFERYPEAADYADAGLDEIEQLIRSTGFFRNKARSLKGLGQALCADHDGRLPETMRELTKLPGIGRKTANVILGNAFGIDEGVVVDTHVGRLSRKLVLTVEKDPVKVETDLIELVPQHAWTLWAHLLIEHGRQICKARRPECPQCALADLCPSAEL